MLYLTQIDEESTVTADYHRIVMQVCFYLFGSGSEHVGTNFAVTKVIDLHVVSYGLYI